MAGPTILWLSRHEPELYRRARWAFQAKDWLRLRLTGEAASDPTDASGTLLFDVGRRRWAIDVADALGVRADLLPPLQQPAAIAGNLRPDAASHLGLRAGLPVAVGATNTAASVLAAALPVAGWSLLTLGTGGQWAVPVINADTAAGRLDPSGRTNLFGAADGGAYRLAAAQNVGITLDWVISILHASWAEEAAVTPPGSGCSPALCNGQLLPISQNQALFSLLGTTYGGDGVTTFGLPNLQGRTPNHMGQGFTLGQMGGEQAHVLTISEASVHTHSAVASSDNSDAFVPTGNYLGAANNFYAPLADATSLPPGTLTNTGGTQPHENMQPYLVLSFCIALQGIFPSQN